MLVVFCWIIWHVLSWVLMGKHFSIHVTFGCETFILNIAGYVNDMEIIKYSF